MAVQRGFELFQDHPAPTPLALQKDLTTQNSRG